MRILLVGTGVQPIPPTGYGGVERSLAEFAHALRHAGQEVTVVNEVRRGRMRDEYPFARSVPSRVRSIPHDILHASTPVVARALSRQELPFVYTTHSRHWFDRRGLTQRWGYHLEKQAVRHAQVTIALTEILAAEIRKSAGPLPPNRLTVIPIGVDSERFQPRWQERTGRVALGVGIVSEIKRWDLAAAALRGTNFRLRLVGPVADPEYAERIRAAGTGVEILGELDDARLVDEFARADLLIHPSRVELLPGVVLQAFASALPVLGASPLTSIVEEGRTGYLAPAGADDRGIVEILHQRAQELQDDPLRRRLGEAARTSALTRFSWSEVVRRHLEVYASVSRTALPSRPRHHRR